MTFTSSEAPSERSALLGENPIRNIERANSEAEAEAQDGQDAEAHEASVCKDPQRSTFRHLLMTSGVFVGAFLMALDSTLMATLAAPIATSLNSLSLLSWLSAAYFIANAVSQPLAGKLTDIYGRKNGMILSNILFGIGNMICALAQTDKVMILGRVIAGLGGGGLGPIGAFVISDLFPLRNRGVWLGCINMIFGVGSGLGGPFGGLIHDTLGWRWAFWLQMPLTGVAIILVLCFMNVKASYIAREGVGMAKYKRVDYAGSILLVSALTLFLLGLNAGGNLVPWDSPLVLVSIPLSCVLLGAFIYVELYVAPEPIIRIPLLAQRTTFFACMANFLVTAARFGLLFHVPIFLLAQGFTATQTGLRLVPEAAAVGLTSLGVGLIMKRTGRYYALGCVVVLIFSIGMALPVFFNRETPIWLPFIDFGIVGTGYSGMLSITITALVAAVDHEHQAVVTSTSYAFRSIGSTLGITVAGALFQNKLREQVRWRFDDSKEAEEVLRRLRDSLDAIKELPPRWKTIVMDSYMSSLRGVFLMLWIVGVVGVSSLLFMKEHKLYKTIGRRDSN
jgi:MFS family permease